ncbi:hypothetical protein DFP72DRAFT_855458 [Ephemerocybe angulata]|uniref:Uncharacterized protein n=1 Tax=Ephemerocybe angulata TaxID=980116 RepID=A0A8H6LZ49_9AGAR|nr:hypothetical protein DFP72DRAFT_855458 [Tulosesus angulatus]
MDVEYRYQHASPIRVPGQNMSDEDTRSRPDSIAGQGTEQADFATDYWGKKYEGRSCCDTFTSKSYPKRNCQINHACAAIHAVTPSEKKKEEVKNKEGRHEGTEPPTEVIAQRRRSGFEPGTISGIQDEHTMPVYAPFLEHSPLCPRRHRKPNEERTQKKGGERGEARGDRPNVQTKSIKFKRPCTADLAGQIVGFFSIANERVAVYGLDFIYEMPLSLP